jgi:hypothetical protein
MHIANAVPLLTLALAACSVDADAADGHESYLIAAVDRPSGNRVEFLATDDGDVLVTEVRPIDNLPTLSTELVYTVDPRDYFRALTGEEAPDDLAELVASSDTRYRRVAPAELAFTDGPRAPSLSLAAASAPWFADTYCDKYYDAPKQWCLLNQRANDAVRKDDVNGVSAVACAEDGEIELRSALRPRREWNRSSWTVLEGHCRQWWYSRFADFDAESAIHEAEGDRYHHAGMMCWSNLGSCPVYAPGRD